MDRILFVPEGCHYAGGKCEGNCEVVRQYEDGKSVSLPCGHAYVKDGEVVVEEKHMMDKLTDELAGDYDLVNAGFTALLVDFVDALGDYICHDIEPSEFAGALCALRDHDGCDEDDAVIFSDTFNRVVSVCEDAA